MPAASVACSPSGTRRRSTTSPPSPSCHRCTCVLSSYPPAPLADVAAFFAALQEDAGGEEPVFYLTASTAYLAPESPNNGHLALSGTAHIGFDAQYKPFPKHWGKPPNAQLKGHDGIMRTLPGGYGKGNAPMANWVKANMEKDNSTKTTVMGIKPYPFGNYSL